jgi:hypothetical protein
MNGSNLAQLALYICLCSESIYFTYHDTDAASFFPVAKKEVAERHRSFSLRLSDCCLVILMRSFVLGRYFDTRSWCSEIP